MSTIKRSTFSGEQKAKVALAAIRGLKTVNEIAQGYGVPAEYSSQPPVKN